MFLFNKYRNAQQDNVSGNKTPVINWKCFLNTNPVYGAESTAVLDQKGNLYFGSHSGNFYSLDNKGKIRWSFLTKEKIYSSPLLLGDRVYFAGGDGFFYCIDLDGNLQWLIDLSKQKGRLKNSKKLNSILHFPFTYDIQKKKNIIYKSWSSPNYTDGRIFITGFGTGLHCFDEEGKSLWKYDLGFPRYQLSGVAIDDNDHIFCASRRGFAYSFTKEGGLNWKKKIKAFWEPWGNPVVCKIQNTIYFFFAKGEKKGWITALDNKGNLKWEKEAGAIRGSCAVSRDGTHIFLCDFQGFIYKLDATNGEIIRSKQINSVSRGLWITPTLDGDNNLLLATKDGKSSGRLIKLNQDLEIIWQFENNKILSVPVINKSGDIYIGSWDGCYYSLKTI
ncbi:PQQ-binding-like beta-propeller repeat protein [Echinicola marina]|uniref:outer membrane protein assembly factor BamB family protein n=1 Tax=Echinicola marina TaxID=2859768 RepID=UPI001CF63436|nr:PQQ-binding-like beta-propeller repeat protein [Echinicola marina]UCS92955.1 PQQ-binding-like beta-propeller repeat protein [Echinicola marina]